MLRNDEDAADAVQDVFLRLLESPCRSDDPGKTPQLTQRIATNLCLDVLRRRKRTLRMTEEAAGLGVVSIPPEDPAQVCERCDAARLFLARLDKQAAEMLCMRVIEGMGIDEIAAELGVNERTVRRKLADSMSGFWFVKR